MATKTKDESSTKQKEGAKQKEATAKPKAESKKTKAAEHAEPGKHKFYCVKCKTSVQVPEADTRVEIAKNGHPMRKGKCPTCGTNLNRILGKNDV